jgi:16S rRNA (uracil1498-N3)-methyltransferase
VLQKGAELGVSRFVPLLTERTIVNERAIKPNKLARWQRILTEAAEQCRRARIPQLAPAQTLAEALADPVRPELALIPALVAETHLLAVVNGRSPLPTPIALFIGPEGGFSPAEIEQAQAHGIIPVSLGPRTLRAETAALAATTLIMQHAPFIIRNS